MKRLLDLLLAGLAAVILCVPIAVVAMLVRLTSPGPVLYWSDRVGVGNRIFRMPKFRTMRIDTPVVATHLLQDPQAWLTPVGGFLGKASLHELPPLWSNLARDMSEKGDLPSARKIDSPPNFFIGAADVPRGRSPSGRRYIKQSRQYYRWR